MGVFEKYAHIFWIPIFPYGKTGTSQCQHCQQVLSDKEFTTELKETYKELKASAKTPIWTFVGLVIIAVLVVFLYFYDKKNTEQTAQYIESPAIGDKYRVQLKSGSYTLYKVKEIKGDSVFILTHQYETDKSKGISDLEAKGEAAYDTTVYILTKKEIKDIFNKKEIYGVDRK